MNLQYNSENLEIVYQDIENKIFEDDGINDKLMNFDFENEIQIDENLAITSCVDLGQENYYLFDDILVENIENIKCDCGCDSSVENFECDCTDCHHTSPIYEMHNVHLITL